MSNTENRFRFMDDWDENITCPWCGNMRCPSSDDENFDFFGESVCTEQCVACGESFSVRGVWITAWTTGRVTQKCEVE